MPEEDCIRGRSDSSGHGYDSGTARLLQRPSGTSSAGKFVLYSARLHVVKTYGAAAFTANDRTIVAAGFSTNRAFLHMLGTKIGVTARTFEMAFRAYDLAAFAASADQAV